MARKVQQSQFYNFMADITGVDEDITEFPMGIVTLDSWFVAMKGKITVIDSTAAAKLTILSIGIRTQPTTLPGRWALTGTVDYDELFADYLANTLEGFAAFGAVNKMPLFYLLCPPVSGWNDGDVINFKKIFRKGIYSGDKLSVYSMKNSLEGAAADTDFEFGIHAQLKQVVSAFRW